MVAGHVTPPRPLKRVIDGNVPTLPNTSRSMSTSLFLNFQERFVRPLGFKTIWCARQTSTVHGTPKIMLRTGRFCYISFSFGPATRNLPVTEMYVRHDRLRLLPFRHSHPEDVYDDICWRHVPEEFEFRPRKTRNQ